MDERTREFDFEEMASRSARYATLAAIHLVSGESAGRLMVLDSDVLTLGRAADCDLQFQVEGVSRHHARLCRTKQNVFTITDTKSTNGLFVNGFATHEQALKDGDRVALGPNLIFSFRTLQADEAQALEALRASRTRDPLTGALNQEYFAEVLGFELDLGQRRGFDVALISLELAKLEPTQLEGWVKRFYHFLAQNQKPGSLIGRLTPNRFVQSLAYVNRSEVEKAMDRLSTGIRQEFPGLHVLWGCAFSRDLAHPNVSALLEQAAKLTRVS